MTKRIRINQGPNYYALEVQGKANQPICAAMVLERAETFLQKRLNATLEEIVERLDDNAPRVAVIMGSPDHPAHVMDHETSLMAAAAIWMHGGVPFPFGVPVMCDGTAQSTPGMSYSLASRNLVSAMVINQMESHLYHGAFVIQGCDKTPTAIVNALASLDITRRARGEAPLFASFAPAHVLRGGVIPQKLRDELLDLAKQADAHNAQTLGDDIRYALQHLLQCTTNQAYQGILTRAVQQGLLSVKEHKLIEKQLAVYTCHKQGGVCAFNGTGNSSRHLTSALGLVHPTVEFLTDPPTFEQINESVKAMMAVCNDPDYGVANIVKKNIRNAVRVHSAMGGSTNIMIHLISCMIYSGVKYSIYDYNQIRRWNRIPDLMDYSLTQGRDIFALAQQCQTGKISGIATVLYELRRNGVSIDENAPTMAGVTWKQRLRKGKAISADNVKTNQIILSKPKRPISGIDVLSGNFMESAVVKISGMPETQLDAFDEKIAVVLYFESEEDAVAELLNVNIDQHILKAPGLNLETLLQIYRRNTGNMHSGLDKIPNKKKLLQLMIEEDAFRMAIVIAGQGPEAYGMPEMFTPMHHINHNQALKKIAVLISDGRYSGVSYGAAIGHVTPEALNQGGLLYLQTGDLLHIRLRKRKINLLDAETFNGGRIKLYQGKLSMKRNTLGEQRLKRLSKRQAAIDPSNLMTQITDAAHGVVPTNVWNRAK